MFIGFYAFSLVENILLLWHNTTPVIVQIVKFWVRTSHANFLTLMVQHHFQHEFKSIYQKLRALVFLFLRFSITNRYSNHDHIWQYLSMNKHSIPEFTDTKTENCKCQHFSITGNGTFRRLDIHVITWK